MLILPHRRQFLHLAGSAVAYGGTVQNVFAQGNSSSVEVARRELVPTGKLRMAFPINNTIYATKNPVTAELQGVTIDLGMELAARLGVSFQALPYNEVSVLVASAGADQWDIATIILDLERASAVDFSVAFMESDATYLVPAKSWIRSIADADKRGARIAVAARSAYDLVLTRTIREATLIRRPNVIAAFETLRSGDADVLAGSRQTLIDLAPKLPGSTILLERFDATRVAAAVPKGTRANGLSYTNEFLRTAIASGWVQRSIDKAGLKGVQIPRT